MFGVGSDGGDGFLEESLTPQRAILEVVHEACNMSASALLLQTVCVGTFLDGVEIAVVVAGKVDDGIVAAGDGNGLGFHDAFRRIVGGRKICIQSSFLKQARGIERAVHVRNLIRPWKSQKRQWGLVPWKTWAMGYVLVDDFGS